jgi:hypothetical protein
MEMPSWMPMLEQSKSLSFFSTNGWIYENMITSNHLPAGENSEI